MRSFAAPSFPHRPAWVAWAAQDADGAWWGFEAEPNAQHNGWYENEVGRIVRLSDGAPPEDWTAQCYRVTPPD